VFRQLDFIYLPSRDVAADVAHYANVGAELVFAIEAFGTRVAMVRLTDCEPKLLLAGHLAGDRPILIYRVDDLEAAIAELRRRRVDLGASFEMPYGPGIELNSPGPQRLALYELTRPDTGDGLVGRKDF
jgi:hypothetical protein